MRAVEGCSKVTFTIPSSLWLTANRPAQHMAARARLVRELHQLAHFTAILQGLQPITGPVALHWLIRYPKGVRRDKGDASNSVPTTKALLDGLVPRWLPDDGPEHVTSETFQRGPNLDRPSDHEITLTITDQRVPF